MNNTPNTMTYERIMAGVEYVSYADYLKLQKELEEAKEPFKIFYNERSKLENERDQIFYKFEDAKQSLEVAIEDLKSCEDIIEKAKAIVSRWDQPSWKDTAPTAVFINALRDAIKFYEERRG